MADEAEIRAEERANCRRAVAILGCYRGVDLDTVNRAVLAIDDLSAAAGSEPAELSVGYQKLRERWLWWRSVAAYLFVAAICGIAGCVALGYALAFCVATEGSKIDGR